MKETVFLKCLHINIYCQKRDLSVLPQNVRLNNETDDLH